MGVLEPGEQHPSTEVQNLRPATHELADVVVEPTETMRPAETAIALARRRVASTV